MRYATWWARAWSLVATLGVGLGMLEWSAPVVAVSVLAVSGVVAVVAVILASELVNPLGAGVGRRLLLARSLAVGAGLVGGFAVLAVSPAAALLLALLAAGTSPPVVARLARRRSSGQTVPSSTPPRGESQELEPDGPPSEAVAAMSTQELCCLWRHTFWQLREETTSDRRASLVTLRQVCLEELERRNPAGFAAWLAAGGRASSAPERFMFRRPTDGGADDV